MSDLRNYFNYFTEIEEHFQRARGTSLFLLSPLDWALIETWKNSEVPLEAVLRGIDIAFEKWRARRNKTQMVNSLTFCSQAVLTEAQRTPSPRESQKESEPFEQSELMAFFDTNLAALREAGHFEEVAQGLETLMSEHLTDLEEMERRLTVLEQKMIAMARSRESESEALEARRELDSALQPFRRKMSAPQLAMLEQQLLDRKLLERHRLPRLSLFHLR